MANNPLPAFNPAKLRSYLLRLPLFTRGLVVVIILFWVLELQTVWSVIQWGALIPKEITWGTLYRLNTFPLIHLGLLHMLLDTICLVPLMERFESEQGTLNTTIMFLGPLAQIPAGLYILVDGVILRDNTPVLGSSIWVFMLLAVEAIKTWRTNPYFEISTYKIPTWITPLVIILVISVLIPEASLLGHLCGCVVGYVFGLGYMKFLAPPEKVLRFIEGKLNLLGRLPHYVSIDQKTYGRYGVLPSVSTTAPNGNNVALGWIGSTERLGP